jgi:hypothetical protein
MPRTCSKCRAEQQLDLPVLMASPQEAMQLSFSLEVGIREGLMSLMSVCYDSMLVVDICSLPWMFLIEEGSWYIC